MRGGSGEAELTLRLPDCPGGSGGIGFLPQSYSTGRFSMDKLSRRSLLRTLAGGALATTGTVVIARATVTEAEAAVLPTGDLQERAARIAELGGEAATQQAQLFVNGGIPLPGGFWEAPPFWDAPYFPKRGVP